MACDEGLEKEREKKASSVRFFFFLSPFHHVNIPRSHFTFEYSQRVHESSGHFSLANEADKWLRVPRRSSK